VNSTGQAKVIGDRILEKERKREFELSRSDRFRYRTRYFTDSRVIGSKEFVSKTYMRFKHHFSVLIIKGKSIMDLIKTHVGMRSDNFIRRTTQYFIFNGNINYTGSGSHDNWATAAHIFIYYDIKDGLSSLFSKLVQS